MFLKLLIISFVLYCSQCLAAFPGQVDQVTAIPGVKFPIAYRHYSGYLSALNGTFLHYWFFESQTAHPDKDPVLLWLNGGPGCSSMLGALTEIGPIRFNHNSSLTANAFAWTQKANVLFIESPAGVGFSYNIYGDYLIGDHTVAQLNLQALKAFYVKFPHLLSNDFYITGESYGGIYIPTLASLVLNQKTVKNFRGVAIGNGALDFDLMGNSIYFYFYYHGFIQEQTWAELMMSCCANYSATNVHQCNLVHNKNKTCNVARHKAIGKSVVNPYNIYGNCNMAKPNNSNASETFESIDYQLVRHRLLVEAMGFGEYFESAQTTKVPAASDPPCLNYDALAVWLNTAEVKKALHIDTTHAFSWSSCRDLPYYREITEVKSEVTQLLSSGLKVLIYNGDADSACNFLSNQWFVEEVGKNASQVEHRPWLYEGQLAGFTTVYDKSLIFTTIRGSGHMVPEDKPGEALKMFYDFLFPH